MAVGSKAAYQYETDQEEGQVGATVLAQALLQAFQSNRVVWYGDYSKCKDRR